MVTRLLAATVLSFAATTTFAASAAAQPAAPQTPVIVARGEHVLKVAPDQAWVTVALETRDSRAPEARRLAATAMTSVLAALRATGLADDAIKTVGYALNPDYEFVNGRQRMRGFVVSNQVQVRVDDLAKLADVLDAAGGLTLPASSLMTVANLRFDLKQRATLERQALQGAVEDAMANAKAMAAGAGATLGALVRIDQEGAAKQMYEMMPMPAMAVRSGDAAVATPITPSDIEIRAAVTVSVGIR